MSDLDTVYREITDHVIARWPVIAAPIVGYTPDLRFQDVEESEIPTATFARFVMDPVMSGDSSFRNGEHGKRYQEEGIIIIQLLVWRKENPEAAEHMRRLGEACKAMFRDPAFPGCYIFRNVRLNRLEPETSYLRANMIAEYEYDQLT